MASTIRGHADGGDVALAQTVASFADAATVMPVAAGSGDTQAAPTASVAEPERFEAGKVIGEGGMGRVLDARDRQFGRRVALKELKGDALTVEGARRFVVEAVVTGNLEHPGVPAVHARGVREGKPFYAMRLVQGRTLSAAIAGAHTLRERIALLPAIVQVAHTLGFAHARGVVHRDVKPDNVIVGEHGETVLLDWGIAKVRGRDDPTGTRETLPEAAAATATVQGQVLGTPAYMAPEQAMGAIDRIDERTDVFALGAMIYHLFAGRPPYEGPTSIAIIARAMQAERPPLAKVAPDAPEPLRAIAERAMAKDPAARYGNAREVADAIGAAMAGAMVEKPPAAVAAISGAITVLALAALGIVAAAALSMSSTLREQGSMSLVYVGFTVGALALSAIEWWTRGRYRLGSLALALSIAIVLVAVASTFAGVGMVAAAVSSLDGAEPVAPLAAAGVHEVSGNLAVGSLFGALGIVAWGVARRRAELRGRS